MRPYHERPTCSLTEGYQLLRQKTFSFTMGLFVALTAVAGLGRGESAAMADPVTTPVPSAAADVVETTPVAVVPPAAEPLVRVDTSAAVTAGVSPAILELAVDAVRCAVTGGDIARPPTLTIIDYSLPSTEPRLWVFDTATGELLFHELVAHGRNTGENMARHFSDTLNSRQSSLGLFVTADTYVGSNGYSLRLDGLEPGFNSHARERAIVMHGAPYVDEEMALRQGRLGRSWGCPALREAVARDVIDTIRGGGVVFSYYPHHDWLSSSRFLNGCGDEQPVLAFGEDPKG